MTAVKLTQAALRADLEWEYGDPVSISFVLADENVAGTYECIIRDRERGGLILAQPVITAVWTSGLGTTFTITLANSTVVPIGYWWYSIAEVNGVTRFSGRVNVGDARQSMMSHTAVFDSEVTVTSEVIDT